MDMLALNVASSVLATFIYDVLKVLLIKNSDIKSKEKTKLLKKINDALAKNIYSIPKYKELLETDGMYRFIKTPLFNDFMKNYILLKTTGRVEKQMSEEFPFFTKASKTYGEISEQDAIDYLTDYLYKNYFQRVCEKISVKTE